MDPILHTIIATGLMYISYLTGRHFGRSEGHKDVIQTILEVFNATGMEINEDGDFLVTTEKETRKVN